MSHEHSLSGSGIIKEGVSKDQLAAALAPMMDYLEVDGLTEPREALANDQRFTFDPKTRELDIYTAGNIGWGYDSSIRVAAEALGPLVEQPGYFRLVDCDTSNPEDALEKIFFGDSPESIAALRRQMAVDAAMETLSGHFDEDSMAAVRGVLGVSELWLLTGHVDAAAIKRPPELIAVTLDNNYRVLFVNGNAILALEADEIGQCPVETGGYLAKSLGVTCAFRTMQTPDNPKWSWRDVYDQIKEQPTTNQNAPDGKSVPRMKS